MSNPLLTPPRREVIALYSGEDEAKLEEYEDRLSRAYAEESGSRRAGAQSEADVLAAEQDAWLDEVHERTPTVTLEAISERRLQELRDANPPRKGNKLDEQVGVDRTKFPEALVRACVVEPEVTDEQWEEFMERASAARFLRLHEAANRLVSEDVNLPKSSAARTLTLLRGREQRRHVEPE